MYEFGHANIVMINQRKVLTESLLKNEHSMR